MASDAPSPESQRLAEELLVSNPGITLAQFTHTLERCGVPAGHVMVLAAKLAGGHSSGS